MTIETMPSPVGDLVLLEQDSRLIGLAFAHRWLNVRADLERHRGPLPPHREGRTRVRRQEESRSLEDLKVHFGPTCFDKESQHALDEMQLRFKSITKCLTKQNSNTGRQLQNGEGRIAELPRL